MDHFLGLQREPFDYSRLPGQDFLDYASDAGT